MDFLKGSITELYDSAYSAIEKVETSSNFTKLTEFCNNSADRIFTPKYKLFHEPENVVASESSNRGKSRRATAKISFQRNDMSKVLTDISSAKTDKRKRELKINWWKEEVMPKIADLWNKQKVLKLADFDANKNTIGDSVELSFRTLSKVNKKDTLKNNY
jgi:hypothetical protein